MIKNRNSLIVDAMLTSADGTAEADAALLMAASLRHKRPRGRMTFAADKLMISASWSRHCASSASPLTSLRTTDPGSAIDKRTTQHAGYLVSQRRRPLIAKVFGWLKPIAGLRKVKLKELENVGWVFQYARRLTTCGGSRNSGQLRLSSSSKSLMPKQRSSPATLKPTVAPQPSENRTFTSPLAF